MNCAKCGAENPSGKRFCGDCGGALANRCAQCGADNPPDKKFCGDCGVSLGGGKPTAAPTARVHTPKHLADKILTSRAALEGERKQVTVLFADVKGSMEMAEKLDPEEWSQIMGRFFQILADGVDRFEGFVDKFTGDGIMALFGAPIAHEDHARRACYAALHLLDGLRGYAKEIRLGRGLNFSARLGLNSGEVIVGKIGDDLHMDYTAQGHTVGLASRMEQIAEPGKDVPDGAYRGAGRGLLRAGRSGGDGDQRRARRDARVRAAGARADAHSPGRLAQPGVFALRRTRRRDADAGVGADARAGRQCAGGGHRRRSGAGQEPPLFRVP
jgi:class 3 adenylate cyclase